ncbi:MAG: AsmA-like C-terminal region-containing protein [Marinobacter sp.]
MSKQEPLPLAPNSLPLRWLARLSALVWWLALALLLLLALYAGLGRQFTADMNQYRDTLQAQLSEQLGYTVNIGELSARWYWLNPEFSAKDVMATETGLNEPLANLRHLRMRVDFLASVLRLRLVLEKFEVDGLDLALRQKAAGQVVLAGSGLEVSDNSLQRLVALAERWLSKPFVRITRIQLAVTDSGGNLRQLDIPQLDLLYQRGLFRASGRAMQVGTNQQLASFRLVGRSFLLGQFTGQLYVDVASGRLFDGLIDDYRWRDIRVEGFDVGGQAWLSFRDGQLEQVNGALRTPYLQLGVGAMSLAPLEDIRARFGWRRDKQTPGGIGEWHLRQLQWRWNGDQVSPFNARLTTLPNNSAEAGTDFAGVRFGADALPLRPLRRLVAALPLLPQLAQAALDDYRPAGFLDAMRLDIPQADPADFQLSARLRDVKVNAHNGAPAASYVQGHIYVDRGGGYVDTYAAEQPVEIEFPELFSARWKFPRFEALVAWQIDGALIRVFSDGMRLGMGERTELIGGFDLRLDQHGNDNLGLQVQIENGDAAMIADLVPEYAVAPALYKWLTRAIEAGQISSGAYYGHGQISAGAPPGSFMSAMWYQFEEAILRYDPQWPTVTEASGRVEVHNGSAVVSVEQANSGGLQLRPSTVRLVTDNESSVVSVNTAAQVPAEAIDFWMKNSPLGEVSGGGLSQVALTGSADLQLALRLPLSQPHQFSVDALVAANDVGLQHLLSGLKWTQIRGQARYRSEQGFSGAPMQAVFEGQPVTIGLGSNEPDGLTVTQSGELDAEALRQLAGVAADAGYGISGALTYSADLVLMMASPPELELYSDLRGLAINWPGPLKKVTTETAPLRLTLDSSIKDGVAFGVNWENRGHGYVRSLDTGFDARVDYLQLGRSRLSDINISALDLDKQWTVRLDSDLVSGRIEVPNDGSELTVDLQHLNLPRNDSPDPAPTAAASPRNKVDSGASADLRPQDWPSANVRIAQLALDGEPLGQWSFLLRPQAGGVNIGSIEGKLESITLAGEFNWLLQSQNQVSRFKGSVTGGQLAELGGLFGADIPLENLATNIELALEWPGRPDQFGLKQLSGDISMTLEDGVILQQNNSAQLFRVFNLLNTDTLWRRLQLDFSDLYERGVAFDALSGKARIANGLLTLNPELQIVGPSGAFKLSGTTDMASETLDMRLVVVVPLTQNLPLAALLMGAGAPIGGALFVLDKILGDPLSKLTSASYKVSGTWDEPKTNLQGVFGAGN